MTDIPPIGRATPYRSDVVLMAPPVKRADSFHVSTALRNGTSMDGRLRKEYRGQVVRAKLDRIAATETAEEQAALARIREKAGAVKVPAKFRQPDWYEDRVMIPGGVKPMPAPVLDNADQAARVREIQERSRVKSMKERAASRRVTAKLEPLSGHATTTIGSIIEAVSKVLGLPASDILGPRKATEAFAREMVSFLARRHAGMGFPAIAKELRKSHSSVFDACHRVLSRMDHRVGLYYVGDRPSRFDGMTYRAVVEELEERIHRVEPIERGLDSVPDQNAGGGCEAPGNYPVARPQSGASGDTEVAGGAEGLGADRAGEPTEMLAGPTAESVSDCHRVTGGGEANLHPPSPTI